MLKNYNEKYKAYLDGALRDRLNSKASEEGKQNKYELLKRFTCTLDMSQPKKDKGEAK